MANEDASSMDFRYLVKRLASFVATILVGATLMFILTRLTPSDPIQALLGRMAATGSNIEGGAELVAMYRERFGLNEPLWVQYLSYMSNLVLRGDFGYSLAYFPAPAMSVIAGAIPWTLGLFIVSTAFAFVVGNLLGAVAAWPAAPKPLRYLIYGLTPISAVPYYILALLLLYVLAVIFPIFPVGGVRTVGTDQSLSVGSVLDILYHATLPGLSIVLALLGFWILSMRGAMSMVSGESYLTYARARGLSERRIFTRYAVRNASLPQVTALALDLGKVVSGQVLVEIIFSYPGVGYVLYNALRTADYFVIQGVVMFIIVSVAVATLILDIVYPLLDPRISYREGGA
jgi:peptide/nickel transport system permease protein